MTRKIRTDLSRMEVLTWAKDAVKNAQEYRAVAEVVASHGMHRKAVGLAILGCEDAAKSLHLFLDLLGTKRKKGFFEMLQRDHRRKQAFAVAMEVFESVEKAAKDRLSSLPGKQLGPAERDQCKNDFETAMRFLLDHLKPVLKDGSLWREFGSKIKSAWKAAVENGDLDRLKQRALYSDPPPDPGAEFQLPEPGETEFGQMLNILDRLLEVVVDWANEFKDESSLAEFDRLMAEWPKERVAQLCEEVLGKPATDGHAAPT